MRKTVALLLAMFAVVCLAQAQALPIWRILPEDIVQDRIQIVSFSTNSLAVRFTYTEAGAKKMLTFRREYAGQEVIKQIGSFVRRSMFAPLEATPPGWTEEGWLQRPTDKFLGVSENDAKKIVAGLKGKFVDSSTGAVAPSSPR